MRTDGAIRWLLVRAETFRDDAGVPNGMLGARIDVTVQRELEEKLRRIYRSKDDLLAVLGHELRQPVQAAIVALGVMEARTSEQVARGAGGLPSPPPFDADHAPGLSQPNSSSASTVTGAG